MKILITGGRGYISSCLGEFLLKAGYDILLASRDMSNDYSHTPPGAAMTQIVWGDEDSLNKICTGIDVVIHAAGMNKKDSSDSPFDAFMFNGVATANLIKAAVAKGVRQFIYLSTYDIYSNPLIGEIVESSCPCNPHPYATSHRAGEDVVIAAGQQRLLESVVLRISNGFGTPTRKEVDCWSLFVNDLCRQAVQTKKLSIRSNAGQLRNFIPVNEICGIIGGLITKPINKTLSGGQNLINIGSDLNMSLLEMAEIIQYRCLKVLGLHTEIIYDQEKLIRPITQFSFNLSRLHNLGYKTQFDMHSEIDDLLVFCQKNFGVLKINE